MKPEITKYTLMAVVAAAALMGLSSAAEASTEITGSNYQGCYIDSTSDRDLQVKPLSQNEGLTRAMCQETCASAGYRYAAMQNGNSCWCGDAEDVGSHGQAPDSDCSTPCAGESSETCGAGSRNEVWRVQPKATYAGCYVDASTRDLPVYKGHDNYRTRQSCMNTCAASGYDYAGLQNGGQCFCGSESDLGTYGQAADDSECNKACTGNSSQTCGGSWRNSVWKITPSRREGTWCYNASTNPFEREIVRTDSATLVWLGNGNLVMRDSNYNSKWETGAQGSNTKLCMQNDGNLVISDRSTGQALWSAGSNRKYVALKTSSNYYLQAVDGGDADINAKSTTIGDYETFELITHSGGTVSLKTATGHHFTARADGSLLAASQKIQYFEHFELITHSDGRVSLKSRPHQRYVVAEGNGNGDANANRTAIGGWERFTLVDVSGPAVSRLIMNDCTLELRRSNGKLEWTAGDNFCALDDISSLCDGGSSGASNTYKSGGESFMDNSGNFGAGYGWNAYNRSTGGTAVELGGRAYANVTLLGHTNSIFEIRASADDDGNGNRGSNGFVSLLGNTIYNDTIAVSGNVFEQDVEFFSASTGIVGIQVSGTLSGVIGLDASLAVAGVGLELTLTPYAAAVATLSASLKVFCFEVGIAAEITLLGVEVPVTASVYRTGTKWAWELNADLTLHSLDGSVYMFANACGAEAEATLFEFPGVSYTTPLFAPIAGCF